MTQRKKNEISPLKKDFLKGCRIDITLSGTKLTKNTGRYSLRRNNRAEYFNDAIFILYLLFVIVVYWKLKDRTKGKELSIAERRIGLKPVLTAVHAGSDVLFLIVNLSDWLFPHRTRPGYNTALVIMAFFGTDNTIKTKSSGLASKTFRAATLVFS